MEIQILSENNSVFSQFIAEIRDVEIQKDSMRFRRNMERIGEIAAYEISKTLDFETKKVTTPLGVANAKVFKQQPVLATVLRAGLSLHRGLQNYFDKAENAFVSAYRKHHDDGTFTIQVEYLVCPDLANKILILADSMLATGQSMALTLQALLNHGKPAHIHIVAAIASKQAVEYLRKELPENSSIWTGAVDEELTKDAYISPGLGDAGDLAFGEKL